MRSRVEALVDASESVSRNKSVHGIGRRRHVWWTYTVKENCITSAALAENWKQSSRRSGKRLEIIRWEPWWRVSIRSRFSSAFYVVSRSLRNQLLPRRLPVAISGIDAILSDV